MWEKITSAICRSVGPLVSASRSSRRPPGGASRVRKLLRIELALLFVVSACNAETNLLGLTVPGEHEDSFDNLLSVGQAAYDKNELAKAHAASERAFVMNPRSERAALLYGFVNLSLAGADPFTLASALVAKKNEGETATSGVLGVLEIVMGLKPEELAAIGVVERTDPDLPIIVPGCVEEVRQTVAKLSYLNDAVRAICPFVDPEARIADDYRQVCEPSAGGRSERNKAHFLWAFAHLAEALTYHGVLTYGASDATGARSNLELRVEKLGARDLSNPDQLAAYLAAVKAIETTVTAIMPLSGRCSDLYLTTQFRATLNDLLAVDAAFARMTAIPPSMTTAITNALTTVKGASTDIAGNLRSAQSKALRDDLTKKMAASVGAKIDGLAPGSLDEAQRASLCGAYETLASEGQALPANCQ